MKERGKRLRLPSSLKVCAIGPATATQLKKEGVSVDYIPKEYIAEAILEGFEKMSVQGARFLLARAKVARDVLPKGLRKMGAAVDVVEAYRTVKPKGGSRKLKQLLAEGKTDAIVTSLPQ
jgi:uroporphyrinogen III methyltransferase/synthase